MIFTFYSYKGGVGRSMALANVAEIFCRRGLDVLIIDFDLEAPGLERYFNTEEAMTGAADLTAHRGVVDLLDSYIELRKLAAMTGPGEEEEQGGDASHPALPIEPLGRFIAPIYHREQEHGALSMLPAGRREGPRFAQYARTLRNLDWNELYDRYDGKRFFETIRRQLENSADVVLIDSRTGVTEMSGVCSYHLADAVVLFLAYNHQNLEGTLGMVRSLTRPELIAGERNGRPLTVLPVPSRVDESESKQLDLFAVEFDQQFRPFMPPELQLGPSPFNHLKVPYVPNYAYLENVAVRDQHAGRESAANLAQAFEKLSLCLAQLVPHPHPLRRAFLKPRVVISHQRSNEDDEKLALELALALGEEAEILYDQQVPAGADRTEAIRNALERADFLIVLLSRMAVRSKAVVAELQSAHQVYERKGAPRLLPVRVSNREPFPESLAPLLDPLPWAQWQSPADTSTLLEELRQALQGGELHLADEGAKREALSGAHPTTPPGGALEPSSPFYVERPVDQEAVELLRRGGQTLTLMGPRQVGKSSLLAHMAHEAHRQGRQTAIFDLQSLPRELLSDGQAFFRHFATWLGRELGASKRIDALWQPDTAPLLLATEYMEDFILPALDAPLTLILDQVEKLLAAPFQSDVFTLLRLWHNRRAYNESWRCVDLVLATAVKPLFFQFDVAFSPFNVGTVLQLDDFSPAEVETLNVRHGGPLSSEDLKRLLPLLGGHPYLWHQALYSMVEEGLSAERLLSQASSPQGPFASHLQRLRLLLKREGEHLRSLRALLGGEHLPESRLAQLVTTGLLHWQGNEQRLRCGLYANLLAESVETQGSVP